MNSAERVFTALRCQVPDRVPIFEWVVHPKVCQALISDATWPDFVEQIGLDAVCLHFMEGTKKTYIDEDTYVDEWGLTWKRTAEEWSPIEGPIKTLEDAKHFSLPDPNAHNFDILSEYVQRFKGKKAVVWLQRADFLGAAFLLGLDNLLVNFIENPMLAHEVLEMVSEYAATLARRAVRVGADVVMLGDDYAYRSGPFMSPRIFKEFILPRLSHVVRAIKGEGAFCVKHSDGNLWPILEMILGTSVDGINPLEPVAGMDIGEVKRKYGDRVCLIGNIDCGDLLSRGSVDDVVRTVRETIRQAAPGGGYIMMSSNSIHSSVKPENYGAMIQATHHYGVYPL